MPTLAGTADIFQIEELSGQERLLILVGRALPYRPISFSGTQRMVKTWYPGSPVATVQVLGSQEDDTTIHGMWKDRFLGTVTTNGKIVPKPDAQVILVDENANQQTLERAIDVVSTIDDFRRKGQLLRVTWGPEIRHGFIEQFVRDWDREQDVAWEIKFSWISIEDPQGQQTVTPAISNLSDSKSNLLQVLTDINNARKTLTASLNEFNATLNSKINKLNSSIQDAFDTFDKTTETIIDPAVSALRLISTYHRINGDAQDSVTTLDSRVSWGILSRFPGDTGPGTSLPPADSLPLGTRITADKQTRRLRRALRQTQAEAISQQSITSKSILPDLIAVFTARAELDLRDVSSRYYGTPHEWQRIARYNKIKGSSLLAGQTILVPRIQATTNTKNPTLQAQPPKAIETGVIGG